MSRIDAERLLGSVMRGHRSYAGTVDRRFAVAAIVVAAMLAHYLWFFVTTASLPLLGDHHSFRQTQTAISTFHMQGGGSLVAYPTPVLGYPWIVPFEAPIYQLTVALLALLVPFELDVVGRITSGVYFAGALAFGFLSLRRIFPGPTVIPILFVALMIASPLYAFWSRTFMIETAAIFWGCVFLYGVGEASRRPRALAWAVAFVGCMLCALAKATTWPGFAIAAGALCAYQWRSQLWDMLGGRGFWKYFWGLGLDTAPLVSMVLATAVAVFAWVEISDAFKSLSEIGWTTSSDYMRLWNYGSLEQRFSSEFWLETVIQRALPLALGLLWFVPAGMIVMGICLRRHLSIAAACVILFLVPMMIFTNLHIRHDYYQTANSIFLIAATAIVIGGVLDRFSLQQWSGRSVAGALALVILFQYIEFYNGYYRAAVRSSPDAVRMQVALAARNSVAEDTALVVFGLDWSSEIHYYAQRKGIAFPHWPPAVHISGFRHAPERYFGKLPLGGIVDCRTGFAAHEAGKEWYRNADVLIAEALSGQLDGMAWLSEDYGRCALYYRRSEGAASMGSMRSSNAPIVL